MYDGIHEISCLGVLFEGHRGDDRLSIGPQPSLREFRELHALGFASVINNRPEGAAPADGGRSVTRGRWAGLQSPAGAMSYIALGAPSREFQQHEAELQQPLRIARAERLHCGLWEKGLLASGSDPRLFRSGNDSGLT